MSTFHLIEQTFGHHLRLRVSGIYIVDNKILVIEHQGLNPSGVFWSPPGGGLNYGEDVISALKREFLEEAQVDIEIGPMLFVHEFFKPPLHAIEIFFQILSHSGDLQKGIDPELSHDTQIIQKLAFMSLDELRSLPSDAIHDMFHPIQDLKDLLGMYGYHGRLK